MTVASCSFSDQIRKLALHGAVARVIRIPIDQGSEVIADKLADLAKQKRTINSIVSRMRASTGSEFRVETGTYNTTDNKAIMAFVTVSCLEIGPNHGEIDNDDTDDDEDDI